MRSFGLRAKTKVIKTTDDSQSKERKIRIRANENSK